MTAKTNKEAIQKFLIREFPGENIVFVGEGWCSIAFVAGDDILRFPKWGMDGYKQEAKVTDFVRDFVSVSVPKISIIEDAEYPYSRHKMLHGNNWKAHVFNDLDDDKLNIFAKDVAAFLYSVHSINKEEIHKEIPELRVNNSHITFDKVIPFLKEYFSESQIENLGKQYTAACENETNDIVLLHSDFSGRNSLVDDSYNLIGVYDWGNSNFGERAFDFFKLYINKKERLLKAILIEYEKISGIPVSINRIREFALIDLMDSVYSINDVGLADIKDKEMVWILDSLSWWL